jgi:hypothetical protein
MFDELMAELDKKVQGSEVEQNDELNALWTELQRMDLAVGTLEDYLRVDNQLAVGGTLTLAEMAADVLTEVEEPEAER